MIDQVTTFSKASKFESYLMLGFGASGKELAEKWDIKYLARRPSTASRPTSWNWWPKILRCARIFPRSPSGSIPRAASASSRYFDEGAGSIRTCHYFNIKVNQPLPADAFTFKTDSKTQYINR